MKHKAPAILLLLTLVVGGGLYLFKPTPLPPPEALDDGEISSRINQTEPVAINAPTATESVTAARNNTDIEADTFGNSTSIDVTSVGLAPLSDAEFNRLQSQLHHDHALLARLLEELRNNTNPQRSTQLIALLGEHNTPGVLQTAAEMVYSGNPDTQKLGLDLLSRLQPRNAQARDMAIELLSSETDPAMLVATMNVLATPAAGATPPQRSAIMDNTRVLANHENANVRSHSIEIIGRWNQTNGADTLTRAINDPHPQVRARAVSALRGIANPTLPMINGLLNVAENTAEAKSTRQSALYSLSSMPLTDADQQRYDAAQTSVRTRQLNNQ